MFSKEYKIQNKQNDQFIECLRGLNDSGRRISQSVKMIDYFVHDILDYAVLKGKEQNFTKREQIFDIKDSVNKVIEIMRDKAEFKNISIQTEFIGFQGHQVNLKKGPVIKYLAKTDEKRNQ